MTSEVTQALLPCPFCGSRKIAIYDGFAEFEGEADWAAFCNMCEATVCRNTESDAISAWNTRLTAQSGDGQEHYTAAMERRPKEIGGVKVGPGLYRIDWKSGGSSLAAIGMCANGAWWIAPTNWVEPATPFRIDEDPEGRTSWHSIEALERIEPAQSCDGDTA